jgi:hypothetical protein
VQGTGTVTLLFTDLVGSTESLVALGEDRFDSVRDKPAGGAKSNLPRSLDRFIGRQRDNDATRALLRARPLVTLDVLPRVAVERARLIRRSFAGQRERLPRIADPEWIGV